MYPSVCVIALIFLSLENVSSCKSTWKFCKPKESPKKENSGNKTGTQSFTCVQRYLDGDQPEAIVEHIITPEQIKMKEADFIINAEIFDDNTEIYCTEDGNKAHKEENYTQISAEIGANQSVFYFSATSNQRTVLMVIKDTAIAKAEPEILKYNETENVTFSCPERISEKNFTQLGIINPASNKIKTFVVKTLNQEFNETHNGTILCCIYYEVSGKEKWRITRHVVSKTLLVYDDRNDVDDKDNGVQETLKRTDISTNKPNTDALVPGSDTDPGSQTKKYVIATAAVVAVFTLIVVIVIWKKRCRKKPKSNAVVLYADLDLLRQTAPETSQRPKPSPGPEEESPYAQIIGEMRPQ